MDTQSKKPGLLELYKADDSNAIATVQELVGGNSLVPAQLRAVLCAAAVKKDAPGTTGKAAGEIAEGAAWRMWEHDVEKPGIVQGFRNALISKLKNPDGAPLEELNGIVAGAAVLIEKGIIKNGSLIEIADAAAEGLGNTKDHSKKRAIWRNICQSVTAKLADDEQKVYSSIFMVLKEPMRATYMTGKSIHSYEDMDAFDKLVFTSTVTVQACLRRSARGEIRLSDAVREKLESALGMGVEQPAGLPLPDMASAPTPSRKAIAIDVPRAAPSKLTGPEALLRLAKRRAQAVGKPRTP